VEANTRNASHDYEEITRTTELLLAPGQVYEIRAFGQDKYKTVFSGYFDNHEQLAQNAARLSGKAAGVYVTVNPVAPALLARASNHVRPRPLATTSDRDILLRRWLPLDFDPCRPSGISSTEAEHALAIAKAHEVVGWLTQQGWPDPLVADSGNGCHSLYRLDLPNDQAATDLLRDCLNALSLLFGDESVSIDVGNFNAARIWKIYGTQAGKGDDLPDRPHRISRVIRTPERLEVVPLTLLQNLAARVPKEPTADSQRSYQSSGQPFDLEQWLAEHRIAIRYHGPWNSGQKWVLERCVWNPDHDDKSAFIIKLPSGAIAAGCKHNSCQGKGWADLREAVEPGYKNRPKSHPSGPSGPTTREEEEPWPPRQPLPEKPYAPTLPVDMIPAAYREWILDVARQACFPPAMVAVPALVATATIIGRRLAIRPWRFSDYTTPPNLWGAIVARPASMKSYAIDQGVRPLKRLAATAHERFQTEVAMETAHLFALEAEIEGLKSHMRQAAKKGMGMEDLQGQVAAKLQELESARPVERRYWVSDCTPEKLADLLRGNPQGLLVSYDELAGWLGEMEKPGREASRAFYLAAWEGTGDHYVDRIQRGSTYLRAICLSVMGGIQPDRLQRHIDAAISGGSGGDGMLQRFQLLIEVDDLGEWSPPERWPDSAARDAAYEVFKWLDEEDLSALGTRDHDEDITYVRFDHEAQRVADQWRAELESRLRGDEFHQMPAFEGHLGKYRSLMPSLALIFSLLNQSIKSVNSILSTYEGKKFTVSQEDVELAADWCDFLEQHARIIYEAEVSPGQSSAHRLAEKLQDGRIRHGEPVRDIYRHQWPGLTTSAEVNSGLEVLESVGWVRVNVQATGGPPTTLVHVHPELREVPNA
jgi:hypothetical protein